MKLINKDDALAILDAEIKDKKDYLEKIPSYHSERAKECWKNMITGIELAYSYINSIEAKDVDLDKEIDDWYNNIAPKEFINIHYDNIEQCAKYFFNLGLKAQKGENV